MQLIGNNLYLHWAQLEAHGIAINSIKEATGSGRWQQITCPTTGRKLICYDTLPPRTKAKLPDKEIMLQSYHQAQAKAAQQTYDMKVAGLALQVVEDPAYISALMDAGKSPAQARKLARQIGWVKYVATCKDKGGFDTVRQWKLAVLEAMHMEYKAGKLAFKAPASIQVLDRKVREYKTKGGLSIALNNKGLKKPIKFDQAQKAIVFGLYSSSQKLSKLECWEQYKHIATSTLGVAPEKLASYDTVKRYLGSNQIEMAAAALRHGPSYVNTKLRPTSRRHKPAYSHLLLSGDGLVLGETVMIPKGHPFLPAGYIKDPQKKWVAGSLVVWLWYDWLSEAIVGYSIGFKENGSMIRRAFKQMLKLHDNRLPAVVHIDRKWSLVKDVATMFKQAGVQVDEKSPYSPNQSMAERLNKEMGKVHRLLSERWVNITNHQINFVRETKDIPKNSTMRHVDEAVRMVRDVINLYNNRPVRKFGMSRIAYHKAHYAESCLQLDTLTRLFYFGISRETKIQAGRFTLTIGRKTYEYEVHNWDFVETQIGRNRKVRVRVDEDHPEVADIYRMDTNGSPDNDVYLSTVTLAETYTPGKALQTDADRKVLGKQEAWKWRWDNRNNQTAEWHLAQLDDLAIRSSLRELGQEAYKEYLQTDDALFYERVGRLDYEAEMEQAELHVIEKGDRKAQEKNLLSDSRYEGISRW